MKIPFDVKYIPQIESGEYNVETRDGKTVVGLKRQILYGTPLLYGIIEELECCEMWKEDGTANPKMKKDNHDLFIITPDPELSEFEKELERFYNHHLQVCTYDNQGTVEDSLRDGASKLLTLARKELCDQIVDHTNEAYENGRADALKDLPRWGPNDLYPELNDVVINSTGTDNHFFIHRGRIIRIKSLEKLPGFNE